MVEGGRDPMLLVASETEIPAGCRVWGTGGWLPPEYREALDWLTLARLLGWGVTLTRRTRSGLDQGIFGGSRWVVIACDPDSLGEETIRALASRLASEKIAVIARAGNPRGAFASLAGAGCKPERIEGRSLRWSGPGPERTWLSRNALEGSFVELSEGTSVWATLEGAPLLTARRVGRGVVVGLAFHPSAARDSDGAATALLKHLLIWGSMAAVAWLDLEGSLVLRMDDPGGAQNVYSHDWCYPKMGESEWAALAAELKRRDARLSIGYVAGWVDDGDPARGTLRVAGQAVARVPGQVHPSPLVKYRDCAGHSPGVVHDYEAEFRGIQEVRAGGWGEVELHGYTHMHPDLVAWTKAPDRYEATSWFRELGDPGLAALPLEQHPLSLGIARMERHFGVRPTTLICPGDQWSNDALERALDLGIDLVGSYWLALRDGDRFCWAMHVCAPYLDKPGASWFDAGLPVVGYFHDREPAVKGLGWVSRWLDEWRDSGAKRMLDYRELAAALGRRLYLQDNGGELCLRVESAGAPALVRPLAVHVLAPSRPLSIRLSASLDGLVTGLEVQKLGEGLGRVYLPVLP